METFIRILYYIAYTAVTAPFIILLVKISIDFLMEGIRETGVDKLLKSIREKIMTARSNNLTLLDITEIRL